MAMRASAAWSTHVANGGYLRLPYDLVTDFEPIVAIPTIRSCRRAKDHAGERLEGAHRLVEG